MRATLATKAYMKNLESLTDSRDKQEYLHMLVDNNRKQETKDRLWQKYYHDFDKVQANKALNYTMTVGMPNIRRELEFEAKIQKNA